MEPCCQSATHIRCSKKQDMIVVLAMCTAKDEKDVVEEVDVVEDVVEGQNLSRNWGDACVCS